MADLQKIYSLFDRHYIVHASCPRYGILRYLLLGALTPCTDYSAYFISAVSLHLPGSTLCSLSVSDCRLVR